MSARISFIARYGKSPVITANYELDYGPDEPDIYGHLERAGFLHWEWEITVGPTGEVLDWGTTLTVGGARWKCVAAAQRPGILGGAR